MAYFGRNLKEFSGYWVMPVPHNELMEEKDAMDCVQWFTHAGSKLSWVEAWYAVPDYNTQA